MTKQEKTGQPEKKFAAGLCFRKLFFIFLIFSVVGAIYEDLLIYFSTLITTGEGVWMVHRGVIYGPFNVIYGFGAAFMCWILLVKPLKNWQIYGLSALIGGVVEFGLSFLQEWALGTRSWDYSGMWLNIDGRTTIPIMLFWGLLGLGLVKVVYPLVSKLIEKIPPKLGKRLFVGLLVFMVLDMLVSWTALARQTLRHNNVPPFTPIGELYDTVYTDERLKQAFPNMERDK